MISDSPPTPPPLGRRTGQEAGRTAPERGPASSRREPLSGSQSAFDGFSLAVMKELTLYLSEPNARALLLASAASAGVAVEGLGPAHLALIVSQITKTFDVFGVGSEPKAKCLVNLHALARSPLPQTEIVVPIVREGDIVTARESGKQMCAALGFSEVAYVKVATAISELARNIVKYAREGAITSRVLSAPRRGIEVVAADSGPGISDPELVMSPRYRSRSGMGVGLRGTRRLMDDFELKSEVGRGTTVTIRKYLDM